MDLVECFKAAMGGCSLDQDSNIIDKSSCYRPLSMIDASVDEIRVIEQIKDEREGESLVGYQR